MPIALPMVRAVVWAAEAVPARSGPTLAMMTIVLGARKMAVPVPVTAMRRTMPATDVVGPSVDRESSPPATTMSPAMATRRGPTPSARCPGQRRDDHHRQGETDHDQARIERAEPARIDQVEGDQGDRAGEAEELQHGGEDAAAKRHMAEEIEVDDGACGSGVRCG